MDEINVNDQEFLRARWNTADGKRRLKEIFQQRFFLDSIEKKRNAIDDQANLISDLRGIDMQHLTLNHFLLFDTDIRWGNFGYSKLEGPFQDVDLTFSNFECANICESRFWNAKMLNCNFKGAEIRNSTFEGVVATGTSFESAKFDDAKFFSSDLRNVNFKGAIFMNCQFYSVKLDVRDKAFWNTLNKECMFHNIEWC